MAQKSNQASRDIIFIVYPKKSGQAGTQPWGNTALWAGRQDHKLQIKANATPDSKRNQHCDLTYTTPTRAINNVLKDTIAKPEIQTRQTPRIYSLRKIRIALRYKSSRAV